MVVAILAQRERRAQLAARLVELVDDNLVAILAQRERRAQRFMSCENS